MIRPASRSQIAAALDALAALDVKITEILYFILSSSPQHIDHASKFALDDLSDHGNYLILLDLFKSNPAFANGTNTWIHRCTSQCLIDEVKNLSSRSSGWLGHARASTVEQFEAIDFANLALTAKNISPTLWGTFEQLFSIPKDSDHGDDSITHVDDVIDEMDTSEDYPPNSRADPVSKLRELVCE